jgi:hypothetical protein
MVLQETLLQHITKVGIVYRISYIWNPKNTLADFLITGTESSKLCRILRALSPQYQSRQLISYLLLVTLAFSTTVSRLIACAQAHIQKRISQSPRNDVQLPFNFANFFAEFFSFTSSTGHQSISFAIDHRTIKIGLPVRSAALKNCAGRLV